MVYGDHNPTTHVPGFLTNNKDIANFIPVELYPQRKPAAWEEAILKGASHACACVCACVLASSL